MLHAVTVLELAAVIHSDGLECAVGELGHDSIQGLGGGRCGLAASPYNHFKACQAFGENKEGLPLAFCGAYNTVHFPMAKGQAVVYMSWAAVYSNAQHQRRQNWKEGQIFHQSKKQS